MSRRFLLPPRLILLPNSTPLKASGRRVPAVLLGALAVLAAAGSLLSEAADPRSHDEGTVPYGPPSAVDAGEAPKPSGEDGAAAGRGPVSMVGDRIEFHYAFLDPDRNLLLSSLADGIGRPTGDPFRDVRQQAIGDPDAFKIPENNSIPLLGEAYLDVASGLIGLELGDTLEVPVRGAFPGYTEEVVLERLRGPFPFTMTVSRLFLDDLTTARVGDRIRIDDLLPARILSESGGTTVIQFELTDQEVLPIRRVGLDARVIVDEQVPDRFHLFLSANDGHEFSLTSKCKISTYVLPRGSYRVAAQDATTIRLDRSPVPWPHLMNRDDLLFVMEVVHIEKEQEDDRST